jgi:diguanylate cyclase (GGDEF)-like protein
MVWLEQIFTDRFMPHGHCLEWRSDLLFLYVAGDVFTIIAYAVIPLALVYLVKKRTDLSYDWICLMFATFIFLCGISHLLSLLNIWHGYYYIEGISKLATGLISIVTAIMVWRLMPKALAIPSNDEFRAKNHLLEEAQKKLIKSNQLLEKRVMERTKELAHMARTDALTNILNRGGLMENLSTEIERSSRYQRSLTLLMVDLDHFKYVNDNYGHPVGDTVLAEAAAILKSACRATDSLGRYGGEEFLILLPETSMSEATELAERIRSQVEQHHFCSGSPNELMLTCSIGVTSHQHKQTQSSLLKSVDDMLYNAKKSGRNKVCINQ